MKLMNPAFETGFAPLTNMNHAQDSSGSGLNSVFFFQVAAIPSTILQPLSLTSYTQPRSILSSFSLESASLLFDVEMEKLTKAKRDRFWGEKNKGRLWQTNLSIPLDIHVVTLKKYHSERKVISGVHRVIRRTSGILQSFS
ncbi:hypothetical protein Droror1_Dr00013945 [Drosera rotundifolia]